MFGRFEQRPGATPFAEINVTPLVDVMLVLVVILIVTAPLLGSALQLQLPAVEGARAPAAAEAALSVAIDARGILYLDDRPIEPAALRARLTQVAAVAPETELRLRADGAVPYARVAAVIGMAQAAGLGRIAFAATPQPAAAAERDR